MSAKRAKTPRRKNPPAAKAAAVKTRSPQRRAAGKATAPAAKKSAQPVKRVSKKPAPRAAAAPSLTNKAPASKASTAKAASGGVVKVVEHALDEMKAVQVKVLDVRQLTDIADTLIIASGNSDRHVRSIADRVIEYVKKAGLRPTGVEGERDGEWVLVDLQDVIVHIMLPRVREFYRLESLWDISAARREAAVANGQ
jgi:ribosome-associated protein